MSASSLQRSDKGIRTKSQGGERFAWVNGEVAT
jgi:hypothetical protein